MNKFCSMTAAEPDLKEFQVSYLLNYKSRYTSPSKRKLSLRVQTLIVKLNQK